MPNVTGPARTCVLSAVCCLLVACGGSEGGRDVSTGEMLDAL